MNADTTMEQKNTPPHWAAELGRQVAERRAARQADAVAETAAQGQRAALPASELTRRFVAIAVRVVAAVDEFGRAAGVELATEPTGPDLVLLWSGDDRLDLRREDDTARVRLRSRSRGDEFGIDLDGEAFDPEPAARRIAQAFISQLSITHGGSHVHHTR